MAEFRKNLNGLLKRFFPVPGAYEVASRRFAIDLGTRFPPCVVVPVSGVESYEAVLLGRHQNGGEVDEYSVGTPSRESGTSRVRLLPQWRFSPRRLDLRQLQRGGFFLGHRFTEIFFVAGALAVVAGDEHVDRGHHEEGEAGADDHAGDEHDADGVARAGAGAAGEDEREVADHGGDARS